MSVSKHQTRQADDQKEGERTFVTVHTPSQAGTMAAMCITVKSYAEEHQPRFS